MNRRTLLRLATISCAGLGLMGHSPYRQWQVYRKTRLIILTSAEDSSTVRLGEAIASLLAAHLPGSRAMAARARDSADIVSLLASLQLDVGLLAAADARAAFDGAGRFADDGAVPLRALAAFGAYLFVCREDFPPARAYQIAKALAERWQETGSNGHVRASRPDGEGPESIPVHSGALEYYLGRPPAR